MTLSPKTVISNFPVANNRERMLRIGLERALRSIAATPTRTHVSKCSVIAAETRRRWCRMIEAYRDA